MARVSGCIGSFVKRAGTGTQDVTGLVDSHGVPFQPKALLFWSVLRSAADGFEAAAQRQIFGLSDGVHHAAVSHASAFGSLDTSVGHRNDAAIIIVDLDNSLNSSAVVSAVTSGGFTVEWGVAAGHTGVLINFLAIGGSNVRAHVGDAATNTSAGHQSFAADLGGDTPDLVFFLTSVGRSAVDATTGFGPNGVGWMTATQQGAASNDTALFGSPKLRRAQRADRCILAQGAGGVAYDAELVSMDVDGFTVNWISAAPGRLSYLALSGISAVAGALIAPSVSGSAQVTTTGFPEVALLMSDGNIASASVETTASEFSFGGADRNGAQRVSWSADRDAAGTTARYESDAAAVLTANKSSGSVSTEESRGAVTLGLHSLDVAWTITNADQAQVLYVLLADSEEPVEYEDPCAIRDPRLIVQITIDEEVVKYSTKPIRRDDEFNEPRVLSVGPVTKMASDPSTGAWSAQSADAVLADTDLVNRARAHDRTSLRHCPAQYYIASKNQIDAGGPPRILLAGEIHTDHEDPNRAFRITLNDLIGAYYSVNNDEKSIPERLIPITHFPTCPEANIGKGEPIVVGRHAPLSIANGEGVVPAITVGRLALNGTPGTPTATTLADLVAALQAAKDLDNGSLYATFGPWFGYADVQSLQDYAGPVPSDFDSLARGKFFDSSLAPFIGLGGEDITAYLNRQAVTGATECVAALVAAHAIKEVLNGSTGDPSVWIDALQLDPAELGTQWWCPQIPGDATWGADFGPDLFTDIVGSDGVTRRYTLVLFAVGSTYGDLVEAGGTVHLDCLGAEDAGDGTGDAITEYFAGYRHILIQFLLQTYYAGAWLPVPTFLFVDGVTVMDAVDAATFDVAAAVWALAVSGGLQISFRLADPTSIRQVIQDLNFCGGCLQGYDDFGRFFIKAVDFRRTQFLQTPTGATHEVLRDKRHILPGLWLEGKPEWQANLIFYEYGLNFHTGRYEHSAGGGGTSSVSDTTSIDRFGILKRTIQLPHLRQDLSASGVAAYYLRLFKNLPRIAHYRRPGPCSLGDDILQGLPITHFNGLSSDAGVTAWVENAVLVLARTFQALLFSDFAALDFEGLLVEEETEDLDALMLDPIALEALFDDVSGEPLYEG